MRQVSGRQRSTHLSKVEITIDDQYKAKVNHWNFSGKIIGPSTQKVHGQAESILKKPETPAVDPSAGSTAFSGIRGSTFRCNMFPAASKDQIRKVMESNQNMGSRIRGNKTSL